MYYNEYDEGTAQGDSGTRHIHIEKDKKKKERKKERIIIIMCRQQDFPQRYRQIREIAISKCISEPLNFNKIQKIENQLTLMY